MKKLIIAEKPSLSKNILAAIGKNGFEAKDGYYEGPQYIISWVFGHLLTLKDIEEYNEDYDPDKKYRWTMDPLPFFPKQFQFQLKKDAKTKRTDSGIKKQYNCLKKLIARNDVSCIIHAGDADREGEVIIRNLLNHLHNNKPVKRLWMPEQTYQTIRDGLDSLQDDAAYDNLFQEGLVRTYIDWLYGVNMTRLVTLKSGQFLRVGRVIVPIVKAIYDRDTEIEGFTPEPYYVLCSKAKTNGIDIELTSKKKYSKTQFNDAQNDCDRYNAEKAYVTSVKKQKKIIPPGKLYSLSKLQGVLGKRYKMSPKESLDIIQKLYESGYITYPRTNSEYLASAEAAKINQVISLFQKQGFEVEPKDSNPSIYDDTKIESHSALCPTYQIPDENKLTEKQWLVYETIRNRFLAVFCAVNCEVERTTIVIKLGDLEAFKIKGDTYINKGWKKYENLKTEDKELPRLAEGDVINVDFKPIEKVTSPPKHYTVETLNNYLKNPLKKESSDNSELADETELNDEKVADDTEDYKAIFEGLELGTEATRTGIIENAISSKYILLKNNSYYIQPAGKFLITCLADLNIDMDIKKTAELGQTLKKVYRQELTVSDGIKLAENDIRESFNNAKTVQLGTMPEIQTKTIGSCPVCGSDVNAAAKGYFCSNKECRFALWPTMKYYNNTLKITETKAKKLLSDGRAVFKLKSKSGNKYDAYLKLTLNGKYVNFEMDGFPPRKK